MVTKKLSAFSADSFFMYVLLLVGANSVRPHLFVGLKIGDGGYVNASCKGYDYLKIDGKPVQFRVTALGKRRFRISTESTDYVKVLANSKGGKLSFADLEPENSAQVWILN